MSLQALLDKLTVECDERGPFRPIHSKKNITPVKKSQYHGDDSLAGKVRFADPDDRFAVFNLCTDAMKQTFRIDDPNDIVYLIENCVLCITQLDPLNTIIGFVAASQYPNIPSVHPNTWEEYVWAKYKAIELKARDTLWLHLICWDTTYSKELINAMLKTIYMHDPYVEHIAFIKTASGCAQLVPGAPRAESSFRVVLAVERGMAGEKLPLLQIADRSVVSPRLKVRRAVEEDNDDLLPIIAAHSRRLRDLYGDFYIRELIAHPVADRIVLVCEHKEIAVGLMILNTDINFEALEECFELSPYAGFRKLDQPPTKQRSRDRGDSCLDSVGTEGEGSFDDGSGDSEDPKSKGSKCPIPTEQDIVAVPEPKWQQPLPGDFSIAGVHPVATASMLNYLDLLADEEEEVEYDIVNIDPELLKPPERSIQSEDIFKTDIDYEKGDVKVQDILKPRKEYRKSVDTLPPTTGAKPSDYITRYSGPSNAFLMEVFAMHSDYDERYGFDMLEAAFELFPDRDYCIMCLPSKNCVFPLLEHFSLVAPHTTLNERFINDSLFVSHINSVRGEVSVRPAEQADLSNLVNVLEHARRRTVLSDLVEASLLTDTINSYMLLAQNQPIGVVIVGPLEEGTWIRNQFDLLAEPRNPGSDGVIIGGVMSPVVDAHSRWYLREVIRQSRFTTLFWICQPFAKGDLSPARNMMSLTERMVPVKPRKRLPNYSKDPTLDLLCRTTAFPMALWMIENPITSLPMVYINNAIVVVGASRTGLSFIESLVLGPSAKHLTFTNVTLISEHGVPTVAEGLKAADTCVPTEGRYTDEYLKSVPICVYIDVIPALVTAIDRKQKRVKLSSGGYKYYDTLVLTCGLQFQHPDYLKESLNRAKEVIKGNPCERTLMDDPKYQPDRVPPPPLMPNNLFVVNSLLQANMVLRRLLKMVTEHREDLNSDNPIIVYGDCLEAYCCMAALLELGVRPREIGFIENFPPDDPAALRVNCFNDLVIDERIQHQLEELGIKVMRKFRLIKAYTYQNTVTSLCLMDALHSVTLSCFALFYYGQKSINIDAFKAINECGLVYDGGLIVSAEFETNDPSIYGAGTCCNYARQLYSSRWNHKVYNSEDIGESLACIFLKMLDPFIAMHPDYEDIDIPNIPRYSSLQYRRSHASIPDVRPSRFHLTQAVGGRKWEPVMKFTSPIMKYATLPGPLYYLKIRKPGPDIPMEAQLYLPHQGHTLVTDKPGHYFRLRLNSLHVIDAITCLSIHPISAEVLIQLYGKHEAIYNKLLLRYKMDQIDDLFAYFKQPWLGAMYQETFKELIDDINYQEVGALYEDMRSKYALADSSLGRMSLNFSNPRRSTCSDWEECQEEEAKKIARFRSMIDKYVVRTSSELDRDLAAVEVESECGQNAAIRDEIGGFWEAVGAERIVFQHIARHLQKYGVSNPQYAKANINFYDETQPKNEE